MEHRQFKTSLSGVLLLGLPLLYGSPVLAAKPIDLSHQPVSALHAFVTASGLQGMNAAVHETSRQVDMKRTTHVRVQQTYAGYPVWGADAVIHIPAGAKTGMGLTGIASSANSADGTLYQDLNVDLGQSATQVLTPAAANKALHHAVSLYQEKAGHQAVINHEQTEPVVFVDQSNKAHWAYKVSFNAKNDRRGALPAKPVYLIDAMSQEVYAQWDNIKTLDDETLPARGGGFGGNQKMGKLVYDGKKDDLAILHVTRNATNTTCYLKNKNVTVKDYNDGNVPSFKCANMNKGHNFVYFDKDFDAVNGGYSPDNDALFGGQVIKHMYQDWYHVPVLTNSDGSPMMLNMVVHAPIDNAYWYGSAMTFGDGVDMFYPLTSLGVAAHEISHGFTEQHSNLYYYGQSGGMNEAYSDMAAQAAEMYAYGKNSWQIGPEIFKEENEALRYMDKPSKDCHGSTPGNWCSIDDASQYHSGLDVHFSSGVYNRFFYTLGTTQGWDAKKAFDVMVQANSHYWTSNVTFIQGACGVIKAAKDLGYNVDDVKAAFAVVKVDTSSCN